MQYWKFWLSNPPLSPIRGPLCAISPKIRNKLKTFQFLFPNFRFLKISLLILLTSCSKTSPSGFWNSFNKNIIIRSSSDQGPFGGKREIEWKDSDKKLTSKDFLNFAEKNGWKIEDSISIQSEKLNKTQLKNVDSYSLEILEDDILPKVSFKKYKIYIFKTGWLNIKPGTEIQTEQNGFLIVETENSIYKVFHYWGE